MQIARLELANIKAVHAFARRHSIACDLAECDTVDVVYDAGEWQRARDGVAAIRAAVLIPGSEGDEDPVARYELFTPDEVRMRFYCHDGGALPGREEKVHGGLGYFAGSLSVYKFTVGVLKLCLARGLNLQANTAALRVTRNESDTGGGGGRRRWTVHTPRGEVAADRVVLATNGYTAALMPSLFQGVIVPVRGQVAAHRPGRTLRGRLPLPTTYSFIYEQGYEYMVPRPPQVEEGGDIIIGGGLFRAPNGGLLEYGTADDTMVNGAISEYLRETTPR